MRLCVSSGQVFRWKQLRDGGWLGVEGEHWYKVQPAEGALQVESSGEEADFRRLFRLDWDAEAIEREVLRIGPELKPYMDGLRGLRLMRPSSDEETFFCFLCTPNNHIGRITAMIEKLSRYGEAMAEVAGQTMYRFPGAEKIASIPEDELRAQGFGYRGGTIPRIARQMLDRGDGWLASLRAGAYEEAHKQLVGIKGIGPKLADCIALFALDFTEAVPVDTHLWQAFTRLYHPEWQGAALTDRRYEQAANEFRQRFGKLSGWAHQYLFYDNVLFARERRRSAAAKGS